MPAERTRGSRRTGADGAQLVWTMPVEPPTPSSIAFAPALTPVTFNDPSPVVDATSEPTLFPPPDDCPSPRRTGHSKKKPDNHIPRPPNAFILFRSSFIKSQHVSTEVETNHSTLSKIIGLTWQNLPHDERQVWHAKAKAALEEHKRKFPQYAFRPLHAKTRGPGKRKVREVGPKDQKRCAKIAELLVEGKKGQELDAAIQEFDRHHVPEIVTRFEAPLTARMYRRSSSAPIPDTPFLPSTPAAPSRRKRASSSQPTRNPSPAPPPVQVHTPVDANDFYATSPFTTSTYSFPPKTEPSFDFNTFAFGNDVFSADSTEAASVGMFEHTSSPTSLSVDTSFLDDWARNSSPMSSMPATPSYLDSPCSVNTPLDSFSNEYNFDSFDHTLSRSFDLSNLHVYTGDNMCAFNQHCSNLDGPYVSPDFNQLPRDAFSFENTKPEMTHIDLNFSAFMASFAM